MAVCTRVGSFGNAAKSVQIELPLEGSKLLTLQEGDD